MFKGNGNNEGPFVYCGFKPKCIIFKNTETTNFWVMMDSERSPVNYADTYIQPDVVNVEATGGYYVDFVSNGFKHRLSWPGINGTDNMILGIAFADIPFALING